MPPKKRKNKTTIALDLSEVGNSESSQQFVVESYDYAQLQTEKPASVIQFEDDLKYLLSIEEDKNSHDAPLNRAETTKKSAKNAKQKPVNGTDKSSLGRNRSQPLKISRAEITKDIDEICFTSDEEAIQLESKEKEKKKAKRKEKKANETKNMNEHIEDDKLSMAISGIEEISGSVTREIDARKRGSENLKKDGRKQEKDENPVEDPVAQEHAKKTKKKKKPKADKLVGKAEIGTIGKDETNATDQVDPVVTDVIKVGNIDAHDLDSKVSGGVATTETELISKEEARKKKNKSKKKAKAQRMESEVSGAEADESNAAPDFKQTDKVGSEEKAEIKDTQQETSFPKLRSSSAKALSSSQLPEIHPIKTIIGVSHHQIMNMRTSDVKYKTILTLSLMTKMSKNLLQFLARGDIFTDDDKKRKFLHACVLVALHEANGFHNISRKYPELNEWLSSFLELTLSHTRANLTVSTRAAHLNDLDYNVFSYLGHILIWATHLQTMERLPTVMEKYEFDVTRKEILASIGGYHLWDRVRRDVKTMNTKRWKHIQKFRLIFPYEEDQFVAVLRMLDLGLAVP